MYSACLLRQLDFPAPHYHSLRQQRVRDDRRLLQTEENEPVRACEGVDTGARATASVTLSGRTRGGSCKLRRLPRIPIRLELLHQDDIMVAAVKVRDLMLHPDPSEPALLERLDRPFVLREGPQLCVVPALVIEDDLEEQFHRLRPESLPPELLLTQTDSYVRAHVLAIPGPHY